LTIGAVGSDVKCLQAILNQTASTQVSATGAGSPGNETSYFGGKTLVAVKTFQAENGMTPANQVGPMTRAKLNQILAGSIIDPGLPPVVTPTGSVSAVLSSTTPASGSLINSQATAGVLDINFVGNGTVTAVTLQRSGISTQNTLSAVYLFDGATRLTDGYSFNSNGTLTMSGLSIAVNGSKVISVKVDTSSTAVSDASSIALSLTGLTANGVAGSANVTGNNFTIVTGSAATAYMTTNTASATANVNAGTMQYTMWSDTIQINTRTVQLRGMNFKIIGSAPTNALANVRLFVDGIDAGTVATLGTIQGSNYAMFSFVTPVSLTTGTHTIDVRADVVTGASRTVQLSVQQAADVTLYDTQVGVNLAITATSTTAFTADSGTTVTILTGSSSIVVEPTFNSQTNITAAMTNAVIGKFTIRGYGEDVKVNTLYVTPKILSGATNGTCTTGAGGAVTGGACGLNNVTLYLNGSQIGTQQTYSSTNMSSGTQMTFTLGSQMIIPAGVDSTLEVRADLQTTGSENYTSGTVTVTVEGGDLNNAQGQSSSEIIDLPTGDITTSGLTISSASLVVTKNSSLASYTAAPGTPNVKIGSFTLQNQSTSEATRLTTLTVALTSDGTTALTANQLNGLRDLRTSVNSTSVQPSTSNTFSVNDVIQPGASMTVDIFANVGSSDFITAVVTRLTVASIGAVSNISSAGTITTGQTVSFGAGTITNAPTLIATSTSPSQYVVGGLDQSQATFNFISTAGASEIKELKFTVTGSDANPSQTVATVCVGTVCQQPSSNVAWLQNLSLAVPNGGGGLSQAVKVTYNEVGTGKPVIPNKTSTLSLSYVKYTTGNTTKTLCTAAMASCTDTLSANVDAYAVTLVGSKPTVTVASSGTFNPAAGNSTIIGDFTISPTGGAIKMRTVVFNVVYSGYNTLPTSISAASLTDASGTDLGFTCTPGALTTGAGIITCTNASATYATDMLIDSSKRFNLYATQLVGAYSGGSIPQVSTSLAKSTFVWDDTSYNGVGSNGVGLTGTLINGFPTNSYVAK
jgi:hypothetical protein